MYVRVIHGSIASAYIESDGIGRWPVVQGFAVGTGACAL